MQLSHNIVKKQIHTTLNAQDNNKSAFQAIVNLNKTRAKFLKTAAFLTGDKMIKLMTDEKSIFLKTIASYQGKLSLDSFKCLLSRELDILSKIDDKLFNNKIILDDEIKEAVENEVNLLLSKEKEAKEVAETTTNMAKASAEIEKKAKKVVKITEPEEKAKETKKLKNIIIKFFTSFLANFMSLFSSK